MFLGVHYSERKVQISQQLRARFPWQLSAFPEVKITQVVKLVTYSLSLSLTIIYHIGLTTQGYIMFLFKVIFCSHSRASPVKISCRILRYFFQLLLIVLVVCHVFLLVWSCVKSGVLLSPQQAFPDQSGPLSP